MKVAKMAVFCKGLIRQVNGQKWPVLEVNFKHCKFKTDNGLSIVYWFSNDLGFVLCKKRLEKDLVVKK